MTNPNIDIIEIEKVMKIIMKIYSNEKLLFIKIQYKITNVSTIFQKLRTNWAKKKLDKSRYKLKESFVTIIKIDNKKNMI